MFSTRMPNLLETRTCLFLITGAGLLPCIYLAGSAEAGGRVGATKRIVTEGQTPST